MSIFCLHVITFCDSLLTMVTLLWEGWKALPQQIISNFYFCLPIGRNSSRAHRWCEPPNQSDSAPVAPVADVRMLFIDLFTIQYHNTFQAHHQASNRTQHCHVWLDPELPDGQTPGCANMHHHISTLTLTTGAPQPSRVLPGHICEASHSSNTIKFADNRTVIGLTTDDTVTAYREDFRALTFWWQDNSSISTITKQRRRLWTTRNNRKKDWPPLPSIGQW